MKPQTFICLLLCFIFVIQPVTAPAFETDQYNLPPVPLADIGDEVSEYVEASLATAVDKVNADITKRQKCLDAIPPRPKGCGLTESERKTLALLRSNDAVAYELFKLLGHGDLFTTKFGNWMRSHKFRGQPDRYKTSYGESIFILNPTDYLTLSATVRLFGVEFGIDKLDHFFQQGHKYYKIEMDAVAEGNTQAHAENKAIKWGQWSERTYYGLLASGVYSNADLYANYAGMRFYQTLTKPFQIGSRTIPATIELKNGLWSFEPAALRENLIKPYITEHLNEAFNPSSFRFTLVRSVRRAVKKYACPDWRLAYPDLTANAMTERSKSLELWNGNDYGFTKKDGKVTIGETCFSVQ
ncbi:MAG: hypothetical protein ABIO36_09245 [Pyrinomonadaceae bacterium]